MKTNKEKLELKQAQDFADNNGYLLAVYQKNEETNNYKLVDETNEYDYINEYDTILVSRNTIQVSKISKETLFFREFLTADEKFLVRLHNTFNLPIVIPIIDIEIERIHKQ
ncbi:MAG: hypothetical protein ACOCP8_02720 [archaeon]